MAGYPSSESCYYHDSGSFARESEYQYQQATRYDYSAPQDNFQPRYDSAPQDNFEPQYDYSAPQYNFEPQYDYSEPQDSFEPRYDFEPQDNFEPQHEYSAPQCYVPYPGAVYDSAPYDLGERPKSFQGYCNPQPIDFSDGLQPGETREDYEPIFRLQDELAARDRALQAHQDKLAARDRALQANQDKLAA